MRPDAVASLRRRLARWEEGDTRAVSDDRVLADLQSLVETLRDPNVARTANLRTEVFEIAARLHWYRYRSSEEDGLPSETDRLSAMVFIGELAGDAPSAAADMAEAAASWLVDRFWIYLVGADPDTLLAQSTVIEATCLGKLTAAMPDGQGKKTAQYVLAFVHWLRYLAEDPAEGDADLRLALSGFKAVYEPSRSLVPPFVREYLDRLLAPPAEVPQSMNFDWHPAMHAADPEAREVSALRVLKSRRAAAEAPPGSRDYAEAETELCDSLRISYAVGLDCRDLDEVVARATILYRLDVAPDEVLVRLTVIVSMALVMRAQAVDNDGDNAEARDRLYQVIDHLGAENSAIQPAVAALVLALRVQPAAVGGLDDYDRGIDIVRRFGLVHAGDDEKKKLLFDEMLLRWARYQRSKDASDLDAAVSIGREAVEAVPPNGEDGLERRATLAQVLHDRFRASGRIEDLSQAILEMRRTAGWRGNDTSPLDLDHLSNWLFERYQLLGMREDLSEATTRLWQLIRDHGQGSQVRLSKALAASLKEGRASNEEELRLVIDGLMHLLRMPDDPQLPRGIKLINLTEGLMALARLTRSAEDVDRAIECAHAAVGTIPYLDPRRIDAMKSLVYSLVMRNTGADNENAVKYAGLAITRAVTPEAKAEWQAILGELLYERHRVHGNQADLTSAIDMFRNAANTTEFDADRRRDAALGWAREEAQLGHFDSAADGFSLALSLTSDIVWMTGSLSARQQRLGTWAWAARLGAACALRAARYETAVELLERGRRMLSGAVAWRRSQVEMVRTVRPDLAERLLVVLEELEAPDQTETAEKFEDYMRSVVRAARPAFEESDDKFIGRDLHFFGGEGGWENAGTWTEIMLDEFVHHSHERRFSLTREWERITAEIQREPGMENIGYPANFADLVSAAADGAIVIVNASSIGSDAVIVRDRTIVRIELPLLSEEESSERLRGFMYEIVRAEFGSEADSSPGTLGEVMRSTQEWLWDVVASPVLQALGHTKPRIPGEPWPRVWWCLTGSLGMFPMHAAGRTGTSPASGWVIDRVISSYTSTLAALLRARTPGAPQTDSGPRMLAVGMPVTPGMPPLRNVSKEVARIATLVPQSVQPLIGEQATVDAVVAALAKSTWLHISCHGTPAIPEQAPAQLYLSDGPLSVSRIGWQWVRGAELAYLSACHTAAALTGNTDEVDHLVASFQSAGFRHVIGTLWGADDQVARDVARDFYLGMDLSSPSADHAAEALHHAVRAVRNMYPGEPHLWAPFVHYGP